jgi:hypothetical protein
MSDRTPVTTLEELETFDDHEMVAGYRDGFAGDAEPGDNRSKSYCHGWRSGHSDFAGNPDAAQRTLARKLLGASQ